ncbi:hypothetical protein L7F22_032760 [Adiantum nelumboides]|nr:hypothetical protein [Adiantum nelumboides]
MTRQVYVSRDVRFCEHEPWYKPKPVMIEDEYEEQKIVRHVVDESGSSTRTISGSHMTEESTGSVKPWSGRLQDKKQDEKGKKKVFEESFGDESFDEEHGLPHLRTPGSKYAEKYVPPYARVEEKSVPQFRRSERSFLRNLKPCAGSLNMEVVSAFLLSMLGGNTAPRPDNIKSILGAVGIEPDDDLLGHFFKQLEGKDVNEVLALGRERFAAGGGGGGGGIAVTVAGGTGGGGGAAPAAEEVKEEKKEEKEESDEDMGFSLFD